jgi:hypothetical protein
MSPSGRPVDGAAARVDGPAAPPAACGTGAAGAGRWLVPVLAIAVFHPAVPPALALFVGVVLAVTIGNPHGAVTRSRSSCRRPSSGWARA